MMKFEDIPRFINSPNYQINVPWKGIERTLKSWNELNTLDLNPDFQRGHVWTRTKQIEFVEFCLRGGRSSRVILFNNPGWMNKFEGALVLVDGKQRLEAVRKFMRNKLPIFNGIYLKKFDNPTGY